VVTIAHEGAHGLIARRGLRPQPRVRRRAPLGTPARAAPATAPDPQPLRPLVGPRLRRDRLRSLLVGLGAGAVRFRAPAHLVPPAGGTPRGTGAAALAPARRRPKLRR
jgi:hypothetical protein